MPVFFRGPDALITHREFTCLRPQPQKFAIRELEEPHIVIAEASGATPHVTYPATAAAAAVAAAGWPILGSATVSVTGLVALAALAGPIAGCFRGRRHSYEVHAFHRGRRVCLFRTSDPRLFGQIRRALVRAMEAHAEYGALP
jgi:hypothetical protein